MNAIKVLNEQDFNRIRESSDPILVDFYADWCGPCKALTPLVEKFAAENPDVTVAKINVDESPAVASEFGIWSIPTLLLLKNGREVSRSVGGVTESAIQDMVGRR